MKRTLSVLGSTGSIGRQTLEVAQACGLTVAALTANRNSLLLEEQARKFRPKLVAAVEESAAADLKVRLADTPIRVAAGPRGVLEAATLAEADTVVTAVMGVAGLEPTLAAIRKGKRIALANKETMVCAGKLVMDEADRYGAEIVPVDSEHSAIFQCLQGCRDRGEVRRLILTASGAAPPQLCHGGQDHHRLRHSDEQGPGVDRGHGPLPNAAGKDFDRDPSGEYSSLLGGIL